MFTNKTAFRPLALLILPTLALSLWFADTAKAQVRIEIPEIPVLPELPMRGGGMGAIMDFDMTTVMGGSNRSMTMTYENGVRKMTVSEDGQKTSIETDQDGKITMRVSKRYTREDMDALRDEHPTLYMSVKGFPEEDEGAEVEFSLNVTKKYEADSEEELKENHPEIYKIFEKYNSNNSTMGIGGELPPAFRALRGLRGGGIRILPEGGIMLDDIRIFEDEKKDEDSEKKESSSKDKDKDT